MSDKINKALQAAEKIERLLKDKAIDEAMAAIDKSPTATPIGHSAAMGSVARYMPGTGTSISAAAKNMPNASPRIGTLSDYLTDIGTIDEYPAANAPKPKEARGKSRKRKLARRKKAAVIVALALACALLISFRLRPADIPEQPGAGGSVHGTGATTGGGDDIRAWLNALPEDAFYTASMNTEWVFSSWDAPSENAYVENVELNTRSVFFNVLLTDTGEPVYSSPVIPVGERLDGITLSKRLPAGEHPATVTYVLVDDDHNELSTVSVTIKLIILG